MSISQIVVKLNIRPGLMAWWGETVAGCDDNARWRVLDPEEENQRLMIEDFLNGEYGHNLLVSRASWGSSPALGISRLAMEDLDGGDSSSAAYRLIFDLPGSRF